MASKFWAAFSRLGRPSCVSIALKSASGLQRTKSAVRGLRHFSALNTRTCHGIAPTARNSILGSARAFRSTNLFRNQSTVAESVGKAESLPRTQLPILSKPAVARWLFITSGLVIAVIIVGGVTRLTESGLSITEWKPITGIAPPLSQADWESEFDKYRQTPEFKIMNQTMTLEEFKFIYLMEWGHRILGRVIGLAFVVPLGYFALRKRLTPGLTPKLFAMSLLIGFQGALGWYMVKSGLEESLMDTPLEVPRVSQYRLAAHLGTALLLYFSMVKTGLAVLQDWEHGKGGAQTRQMTRPLRRFKGFSVALTGLVFLTALSGAFVAGLDAGLVYNEFPYMGESIVPPSNELFSSKYSKSAEGSDSWWRNIFENPTTVQFDHRVLAVTTWFSTATLASWSLMPSMRAALSIATRRAAIAAFAVATAQATLGICTLIYLVPTPLAAAHQTGSVVLLTTMAYLLSTMRRAGKTASTWRTLTNRSSAFASPAASSSQPASMLAAKNSAQASS